MTQGSGERYGSQVQKEKTEARASQAEEERTRRQGGTKKRVTSVVDGGVLVEELMLEVGLDQEGPRMPGLWQAFAVGALCTGQAV